MNIPIAQLIPQPEGKQLEFKRDLSSPQPIMKTLTAFANTAGGRLIIGVADDGQVLGGIEIENPGLLLPGMTTDDMKQGVSQIRNPVIARVFRELDLIEQWGSGIPGILREAQDLGLPEPQITEIAMRLRFTIFLRDPLPLTSQQSRKTQETQSGLELPT
jgi:predicted HTH transcriptional regulator